MEPWTHTCETCHQPITDERAKETRYETVDELQGYERKRIRIVFTHSHCDAPDKIPEEKQL